MCFVALSLFPTDGWCPVCGLARETVTPSQGIISLIRQQVRQIQRIGMENENNSHNGGRKCMDWNVYPRIVLYTLVVFVAQLNFMLRGCEGCGQQYQFDRTLTHSVGILMNISHLYVFIV